MPVSLCGGNTVSRACEQLSNTSLTNLCDSITLFCKSFLFLLLPCILAEGPSPPTVVNASRNPPDKVNSHIPSFHRCRPLTLSRLSLSCSSLASASSGSDTISYYRPSCRAWQHAWMWMSVSETDKRLDNVADVISLPTNSDSPTCQALSLTA